ncbi:MAG: hypothetical protein EOP48_27190 [Sphingobacteriales bacterium]|nr:MAG: hypothetical protein EOP48_27190 [Sphingobacteriales bacterium]
MDRSGKIPNPISDRLKNELEKIAPLGSIGIKYPVGCCCEVRSSNQILSDLSPLQEKLVRLKSIKFTDAIRPRTNQIINRCENCKTVFG